MSNYLCQYLCSHAGNVMVRRYVARALLSADLVKLTRYGLDENLLSVFDLAHVDPEEFEDLTFLRRWLETERARVADCAWDERDPLVRNTAVWGEALGLDALELEIMRFAFLLRSVRVLDQVADACNDSLSALDAAGLIAAFVDAEPQQILPVLTSGSRLRRAGFFMPKLGWSSCLSDWLRVPMPMLRLAFEQQGNESSVIDALFERCRPPVLCESDFAHMSDEFAMVERYLADALTSRRVGANVLLWGPPGTGKTELARLLVQKLDACGAVVPDVDTDEYPMSPDERLQQYRLSQAMLVDRKRPLIVYDEVEELLSDVGYALYGFHGSAQISKSMMNRLLESNAIPTVWITNTNDGVDPAWLRRFDLVVKLDGPLNEARQRLAGEVFEHIGVDPALVAELVEHDNISPAHLQKYSRLCVSLGADGEAATDLIRRVASGDLVALGGKPLPVARPDAEDDGDGAWRLPYEPSIINASLDMARLADRLAPGSQARICLSGPPGTGKSAWARWLAGHSARTLVVKSGSDIMGAYVGQTERAIAAAFDRAEESGAVLLFDEVDSFLHARAAADQPHQVRFVNQFLTSLEHYRGVLVCTTNQPDALDPATLRRFDFKVALDYLKPEQVRQLLVLLGAAFELRPSEVELARVLRQLAGLPVAAGDAEVLLRRYRLLGQAPDIARVAEELVEECRYRQAHTGRSIGFLATAC